MEDDGEAELSPTSQAFLYVAGAFHLHVAAESMPSVMPMLQAALERK
jgi:hypothetical protein